MRIMTPMQRASALLVSIAVCAAGASAQTYVYPAKGQSPDQQKTVSYTHLTLPTKA